MADPYQTGSEVEWVKHANDELTRLVRQQKRQLGRMRLFAILLLLVLGWVVFRYAQVRPLEELWQWDAKGATVSLPK